MRMCLEMKNTDRPHHHTGKETVSMERQDKLAVETVALTKQYKDKAAVKNVTIKDRKSTRLNSSHS